MSAQKPHTPTIMVAYLLHHGKIVYITSTTIPPTASEDFFCLIYEKFTLDIVKRGMQFINYELAFKIKCIAVKRSVEKMSEGEDSWLKKEGNSVMGTTCSSI